jgi:hypothetical protein
VTAALLLTVLLAEPAYAPKLRVEHLTDALSALQKTPVGVLVQAYQYAAVYERGTCNASSERLRVECMMTAARRFCEKRPRAESVACAAYMDVVLSNLLAEQRLVPAEKRYEIMKRTHDWRREVTREVRRLQGELAVDFRLRVVDVGSGADLAQQIDTYCVQTPGELSWQTCAASLLWFIATGAPELP